MGVIFFFLSSGGWGKITSLSSPHFHVDYRCMPGGHGNFHPIAGLFFSPKISFWGEVLSSQIEEQNKKKKWSTSIVGQSSASLATSSTNDDYQHKHFLLRWQGTLFTDWMGTTSTCTIPITSHAQVVGLIIFPSRESTPPLPSDKHRQKHKQHTQIDRRADSDHRQITTRLPLPLQHSQKPFFLSRALLAYP